MRFVFLCVIVLTVRGQEKPGVKLRMTGKGLRYISEIALKDLNEQLGLVQIPDVTREFKRGEVTAKEMRVTSYTTPTAAFVLTAPNRIAWNIRGGRIEVEGNWKGKYKKYVKIRGSGSFKSAAQQLDMSLSFALRRNAIGLAEAYDIRSHARVGDLDVDIKGGVVGWLLHQFRNNMEDKLRERLQEKLHEVIAKFANEDLNRKLSSFASDLRLQKVLNVDYTLTRDPEVGVNFLETSHKGDKIRDYINGPTPFEPASMARSDEKSNSKMLYLWASDYVLNSWMYHAHINNETEYLINEHSNPKLGSYLQPTCSFFSVCLGTLFPEIGVLYPDSTGEVVLRTTDVPKVIFSPGGAKLEGNISLKVQIGKGENVSELFEVHLYGVADFHVMVTNNKLCAWVNVTELRVNSIQTEQPWLSDQSSLQNLISLSVPIVEEKLNKMLEQGVPYPTAKGTDLANIDVKFLSRTLEVSVDVVYH